MRREISLHDFKGIKMEIISNASSHMFDSEHNYSKYEIHVTLNMLLFYNKHLGFVTFRGPSLYRGKN